MHMADQLQCKRGDSFLLTCAYLVDGEPAALPAIRAQVRTPAGKLAQELEVTQSDDLGVYTLSAGGDQTQSWPVGVLVCDIQYGDSPGDTYSTPTFEILVKQDVTHD